MSCGTRDRILIVNTMEIPLPIPFSVIRSPIHIKNALPAVKAMMTVITLNALYVCKRPCLPKPIAMALDSISARTTVTYLVMDAIFFLPSAPSRCISSSFGIAIVISCIMIEDVIYGVIFNARIDIRRNDPPVKASSKLKASPDCDCCSNQFAKKVVLIPGTGSCDPKRITTNIRNVNTSFFLISLIFNAFFKVVNIKSPLLFHQVPRFSP